MKKILCALLALLMCATLLAFVGCAKTEEPTPSGDDGSNNAAGKYDDLKFGFIFLHDENSTYDLNFMNAVDEFKAELGLKDDQIVEVVGVPEGEECYNEAVKLAEDGCDMIFADSFGHEAYMIQAAKEYPDVEFCHATGTMAHTEKLANFHNAFASIYEGRFLAGVVAGLKLNEMIDAGDITAEEAKMGYVGAMPYAEVKSGLTSFYLGAKSICPSVTMDVKYTNSWYDYAQEEAFAKALIADGCVLISQHADSMGAPNACEEAKVPNVSYNGSTFEACPNTFLVSSRINWAPYFTYVAECIAEDKEIGYDYCGTIETGSVELSALGTAVAEGTAAKLEEVKAGLIDGSIKVFDTATFTVNGETVTTYLADVDTDETWAGDTEAIEDGAFTESTKRSAPYFDLDIDGIVTK